MRLNLFHEPLFLTDFLPVFFGSPVVAKAVTGPQPRGHSPLEDRIRQQVD